MTVGRIFTDNTGRRESRPEARESYDKLRVILICLNEEKDPGERGSLYRFLNTLLSFSLTPEEKEHILEEEYGISMKMSEEDFIARMREERENERTI